MTDCLKQIADMKGKICGKQVSAEQIIRTQQELNIHRLPTIPDTYVRLLHHYNIIMKDNAVLFGINPNGYSGDILSENLNLELSEKNLLILGADNFDFMAYNAEKNNYQIIDKDDFKVLQTYQNMDNAVRYILKLEDD